MLTAAAGAPPARALARISAAARRRHRKGAAQVERLDFVPGVDVDLLERAALEAGGAVDQQVEPAEALADLLEQPIDLRRPRQVGAKRLGLDPQGAELGRGLLGLGRGSCRSGPRSGCPAAPARRRSACPAGARRRSPTRRFRRDSSPLRPRPRDLHRPARGCQPIVAVGFCEKERRRREAWWGESVSGIYSGIFQRSGRDVDVG